MQELVVKLNLLPSQTQISTSSPSEDEQQIITDHLDFNLRSSFRSDETHLWKGNSPYIFYTKKPLQLDTSGDDLELYPGFSCRVRYLPDIGFGLVIDTLSVFTDLKTLGERLASGELWRSWIGRHFIYEFGYRWFFIQLKNVEKKSIDEAEFSHPVTQITTNLYDYLHEKWKDRTPQRLEVLKEDDVAVTYGSQKKVGGKYAAASLIRLRYKTNEEAAQKHHTKTIVDAEERLNDLQTIIHKYIEGKVKVDGVDLTITDQPASIPYRVFSMPSQRFGHDRVLTAPRRVPELIADSWRKRRDWLQNSNIGIYSRNDAITSHYFVMPSSLTDDEEIADQIVQDIKGAESRNSALFLTTLNLLCGMTRRLRIFPKLYRGLVS